MSSYEKINYSTRPAKHIERRMVLDLCGRLRTFGHIERYHYVGLGSPFFADFALFHRSLGLRTLTSIERDAANRDRFEFNRPYAAIDIVFGESSAVLPTLSWSDRAIVWLDYDDKILPEIVGDIEFLIDAVTPGSLVLITVNAQASETPEQTLSDLQSRMGDEAIPFGLTAAKVEGWGLARVSRSIIDDAVNRALSARNGREAVELRYDQLMNVHYSDGARMLTVGGIVYAADMVPGVAECGFDDFSFVRRDAEPYQIRVPSLTLKEVRHLGEQLPSTGTVRSPDVPQSDIDSFAEVYRYFPRFVDADY